MNFIKRFQEWITLKEKLRTHDTKPPLFKEGEIWWCGMGENIGVEVSGKNQDFSRPVLVFKKLSKYGFLGIPTSTKIKDGTWYVKIDYQGKNFVVNLSQTKFFSYKRLYNKITTLDSKDFYKTKQAFADLFCSNAPQVTKGNVANAKYDISITDTGNQSNNGNIENNKTVENSNV